MPAPLLSVRPGKLLRALTAGPVIRDPVLRTAAILMVMFGAVVCSLGPYVSVLAVQTFALGDRGYAVLLAVSTLMSVSVSVGVGIRADQTARRRFWAIFSLAMMTTAMGVVAVWPARWTFLAAHVLLLPLSAAFFGQVFALARQAASTHPPDQADGIMATIRALFALPFVLVLPLWAVAFAGGAPLVSIYRVGVVLSAGMVVYALRHWPRDGATRWADAPSGLSLRAALSELARPHVAGRVLALGAVNVSGTIYVATVALLLSPAVGRGPADVALYAGLVAGMEVPFMLALPVVARGWSRTGMILAGTAIYCIHLALLPVLAGSAALWLLILPASLGGAIILTVPIAYLQDLLSARPATGAALMALQRLAGDVLAALCFAAGTWMAGYGTVTALATAVALTGATALWLADRGSFRR